MGDRNNSMLRLAEWLDWRTKGQWTWRDCGVPYKDEAGSGRRKSERSWWFRTKRNSPKKGAVKKLKRCTEIKEEKVKKNKYKARRMWIVISYWNLRFQKEQLRVVIFIQSVAMGVSSGMWWSHGSRSQGYQQGIRIIPRWHRSWGRQRYWE